MTTLQKTSHRNFIRQRRSPKTHSSPLSKRTGRTTRKTYDLASVYLPLEPKPVAHRSKTRAAKSLHRNSYAISFTLGRTDVRAPSLNLPQLGPRWVSAGSTLFLVLLLYTMWTASPFMITTAEVYGNQRLSAAEIDATLDLVGQPIFKAVPAQIEAKLRTAYSDLESIKVHVTFPNRIVVDVVERTPVLAWYQEGVVRWIDVNGIAFTPRGEVPGLIQVAANGAPTQVLVNPEHLSAEQAFLAPEMVQALLGLTSDIPAGMPMIFDPQYGMGWQDPHGWTVYFGDNTKDISTKKDVYKAVVETLTHQGVQPSLISVEFLNAPFYK
jgi:cell division protein FtsQ